MLLLHGDITMEEGTVGKARSFITKGVERLKRGTSVIIVPEGSRSKDGEIKNFKEGAFLLAKEAGVEILPCVINGVKKFIKGWRIQRTTFEISILPPVKATAVQSQGTRETMKQVREVTVEELARLRGVDGTRPAVSKDVIK